MAFENFFIRELGFHIYLLHKNKNNFKFNFNLFIDYLFFKKMISFAGWTCYSSLIFIKHLNHKVGHACINAHYLDLISKL